MKAKCSIIIITHNSEQVIHKAIESVRKQSVLPQQIILVDTGSMDCSYLSTYEQSADVTVLYGPKECGFCVGNNIGYRHVDEDSDYILLLNPDAFLFVDFIEKAVDFMDNEKNKRCGLLTGKVLGYNINRNEPSGQYDTTGVFRRWYGRWYDRGQGEACEKDKYSDIEELPAVCGALMFCRKKAVEETLLRGDEIFDSRFFMYKEDIDLSLRLRQKKWRLFYLPELQAYHCRGWNPDRKKMPRKVRLLSARNELKVQARTLSPLAIIYSMIKYISVSLLDF